MAITVMGRDVRCMIILVIRCLKTGRRRTEDLEVGLGLLGMVIIGVRLRAGGTGKSRKEHRVQMRRRKLGSWCTLQSFPRKNLRV